MEQDEPISDCPGAFEAHTAGASCLPSQGHDQNSVVKKLKLPHDKQCAPKLDSVGEEENLEEIITVTESKQNQLEHSHFEQKISLEENRHISNGVQSCEKEIVEAEEIDQSEAIGNVIVENITDSFCYCILQKVTNYIKLQLM